MTQVYLIVASTVSMRLDEINDFLKARPRANILDIDYSTQESQITGTQFLAHIVVETNEKETVSEGKQMLRDLDEIEDSSISEFADYSRIILEGISQAKKEIIEQIIARSRMPENQDFETGIPAKVGINPSGAHPKLEDYTWATVKSDGIGGYTVTMQPGEREVSVADFVHAIVNNYNIPTNSLIAVYEGIAKAGWKIVK